MGTFKTEQGTFVSETCAQCKMVFYISQEIQSILNLRKRNKMTQQNNDVQAALDALSDMNGRTFSNLLQLGVPKDAPVYSNLRKETEIIKRALAQQQPDAELLEATKGAINFLREMKSEDVSTDRAIVQHIKALNKAIARAEQKGVE